MICGKYAVIVFFIVSSIFFIGDVTAQDSSTTANSCFPEYQCDSWKACAEGLSTRVCHDTKCGHTDITERQVCGNNTSCTPNVHCDDWGTCSYSNKATNILAGNIEFSGYKERVCSDSANCVAAFTEEASCSDIYKLNVRKVQVCGKTYLSASDSLSGKEIARIETDAWKSKEQLNLIFTEGDFSYCQACYNGVRDEGEDQIDCGGACAPCVPQISSYEQYLPSAFWISGGIFFAVAVFFFIFNKTKKDFPMPTTKYA